MNNTSSVSRRRFIGGTLTAIAAGILPSALTSQAAERSVATEQPAPKDFARKIKLGVVGLGGRGNWIAGLFQKHGGYKIHAVADYFPDVAEKNGAALGVVSSRRFSGLSGYKKVIESGVEAIVIIDVPYFYPEQARAAADAGLHIYMAKPVAVDVRGALSIGETGKMATQQRRVFLVDYQMPTDPHNIEVMRRIAAGALGPIQTILTNGAAGGENFRDEPLTASIESRLQHLIWVNDDELGCGYIGNFDIHVVDVVLRAVSRQPVTAHGWGARLRKAAHGNSLDATCVMYTFADGMVWNHQSIRGGSKDWFESNGALAAMIQGADASARLSYWGKACVRGGKQHYGGGNVEDLYLNGAGRNIATFYENITQGKCGNESVRDAVESALVCVLGREAAARRTTVTMDNIISENKKLEADLRGLKA